MAIQTQARRSFSSVFRWAPSLLLGGALLGVTANSAPAAPASAGRSSMPTTAQLPSSRHSLAWTEWELTAPRFPGLSQAPYLKFAEDRVSASVGLNGMGGAFSTASGGLTIGPLVATRMGGPQPLMDAEGRYANALQGVRGYSVSRDGQTLTLFGAQTLTLRLTGKTPQGYAVVETRLFAVGPALGPQMDGDRAPRYLQLEDMSSGVSSGKFTEARILGFQFVPGYRSLVRVAVERDARSGQKQLRLLELFSQTWAGPVQLAANHKILEVAQARVNATGVAPVRVLQVREPGGAWQRWYSPISGFNFQPGWRYRLQVALTRNDRTPADGSSLRYSLVRVLDKISAAQ